MLAREAVAAVRPWRRAQSSSGRRELREGHVGACARARRHCPPRGGVWSRSAARRRARRARTPPLRARRGRRPAPSRTARQLDAAVRERAAVARDDRRRVARRARPRAARCPASIGVERRRLGAGIAPSPTVTARAAFAAMRAENTRWSPVAWCSVVAPYRCGDGMTRVSPSTSIASYSASARSNRYFAQRAVRGSLVEVPRARDRQQPLLRVRPRLRLHPARDAEPGVPVEHPAVHPVAEQHPLDPGAQHRHVRRRQRLHPGGQRRRRRPAARAG